MLSTRDHAVQTLRSMGIDVEPERCDPGALRANARDIRAGINPVSLDLPGCPPRFAADLLETLADILAPQPEPLAVPSCAVLDLEPLVKRKAERDALAAATCSGCGQLAIDGTGTCATCRGTADRAASGTQQALFTPPPAQLPGQLAF